jgi:hypothetical protein
VYRNLQLISTASTALQLRFCVLEFAVDFNRFNCKFQLRFISTASIALQLCFCVQEFAVDFNRFNRIFQALQPQSSAADYLLLSTPRLVLHTLTTSTSGPSALSTKQAEGALKK